MAMNGPAGLIRWAAAALALAACGAGAAETTRYLIYASDGHQGGEQVVERGDDGWVRVRYIFKNNGRGPELRERMRIAADGTLAEYAVEGTTTMGSTVDERFSRDGDNAQWHSTSESGSAKLGGPALYAPLNGSFEATAVGIAALAARPDAALPLLPGGTLTQRVIDTVELVQGDRRQPAQLVAQSGLWLVPSFYWTTPGPKPRLLAVVIPGWLTLAEEGWQAQLPMLAERQRTAEAVLLKQMSAELRHPLHGLTIVRNARPFDSDTATLGAPADVYVLRGRITAVVPAGAGGPRAEHEIDAAGRVMLPGLFDMHGHLDRWDGGLHLAAGVTTVRDLGNDNAKMQRMLDELASGELLAPQVVPCGFLEGESPHANRMGIVIRTLAQAQAAVDWYAAHGYRQIKIYNSFPRQLVRPVAAYAHARGLRVSGHVPVFMKASEAVEQGYDEIQHINQVLLNFLVTPTTDTRTLARFYLPAQRVAGLDFDEKRVADFIALLKHRHTVIDPTLTTFFFMRQRDGELSEPFAPVVSHLPANVQRGFRNGGMSIPDEATAKVYRASYGKMVQFVGRLYRAGVPLVAGTDDFAGFTLHGELELYVQAGLTPAQALQVATRNGARYTGTSADRGSIAPGKLADLVLVDGDPTKNIADVRRVALVLTQGTVVYPAEVHRALGVAPFVNDAPVVKATDPSAP